MLGIIGLKLGMISKLVDSQVVGCTVMEVGPCVITQIRTDKNDGYSALQIGFGKKKEKNCNKVLINHFSKSSGFVPKKTCEIRCSQDYLNNLGSDVLGKTFKVDDVFSIDEFLDVRAKSKGKGFQGVVKRHGFKGVGSRTHGQHNRERAPGSVGASSFPSRVFKGMRMAGRMGGKNVFVGNLRIVDIISDKNIIVVKGAVPGPKGSYSVLYK